MRKYVIMGPQGSGKGTQAKLLEADLDLVHISLGDLLRWHVRSHTRLGARAQRLTSAGELVPDEIVRELVQWRLEQHDWNYGFVLDGFPRNVAQAEFFLERYDVDGLILIEMPDEAVFERVLARRSCGSCGLDYNLASHPPTDAGRCDACQGELVAREDDTPEAIRARLADYRRETEPVVELFRRKGEPVVAADGTPPPEQVQRVIRKQLGLPLAPARGKGGGAKPKRSEASSRR